MKTFWAVVLTAVYVLVGFRAAQVAWLMEERTGRHDYFTSTMMAAVWPATMIICGAHIVLTGNAGVFDSAFKFKTE